MSTYYNIEIPGDIRLKKTLQDTNGNSGSSGQVLTSTADNIQWVESETTLNNKTIEPSIINVDSARTSAPSTIKGLEFSHATYNNVKLSYNFSTTTGFGSAVDFKENGLLLGTYEHINNTTYVSQELYIYNNGIYIRDGDIFQLIYTESGYLSDDRLKFNETTITNAMEVINKLNPVKYDMVNFTPDIENINNVTGDEPSQVECGFIAQDVHNIPELEHAVTEPSNNNDTYKLKYNNILTYSVKAIQELNTTINSQQTIITNLSVENELLKTKLNEVLIELGKEPI